MFRAVEAIFRFPFSILHLNDGDGLENSVDPDPLTPGNDAHGTNAEWYNAVCSNVFLAVEGPNGIELSPRTEEVNTNAYYFVDVVAERGPAVIRFAADGESRLGNPVVVAQAGETNHVPLLIGATYSVTSEVPLQVVAPAGAVVSANGQGVGGTWTFNIGWPVSLGYAMTDGLSTPTVSEAERLQGVFSWTGGCCVRHVGDAMQFCCQGCGCGGCTAQVNYLYEGYLLSAPGPSCGCSSQTGGMPHVETDAGGGVSLGFDRKAVIFEDAYYNFPTQRVARRSTQTILTLRANGGPHGGTLAVTTRNLSRLDLVEGTRPLGTRTLAPYESYEAVSTNEGLRASANMRDVEVQATFTENTTGERMSVHDAATSVRLELREVYEAPENKTCKNRHVYGVGEKVEFKTVPADPSIMFRATKGVSWGENRVDFFYDGNRKCWPSGVVGSACLVTTNYIAPMYVSFQGIAVSELPCKAEDVITGCFTNVPPAFRTHTIIAGAGRAHYVKEGNLWFVDGARTNLAMLPWAPNSRLVWKIPIGWHRKTQPRGGYIVDGPDYERKEDVGSRPLLLAIDPDTYKQEDFIDENGVYRIDKYGHWISRSPDCCVILDGNVLQRTHHNQ